MNATVDAPAVAVPTIPRTPFGGGLYVGRFFVGDKPFALIVSPKESGEHAAAKWGSKRSIHARSSSDGLANTMAMAEAGSTLARWARDLRIGECDEWYLPSRIEALMFFADAPDQFEWDWYWTSTQHAEDAQYAWCQHFTYGRQGDVHKSAELRARAVRRVAL